MMTVRELVERYSLGIVFSNTNEHGFESLIESLELGELPDDVIVWKPFESSTPEQLASMVTDFEDMFTCFIEDLENEVV